MNKPKFCLKSQCRNFRCQLENNRLGGGCVLDDKVSLTSVDSTGVDYYPLLLSCKECKPEVKGEK